MNLKGEINVSIKNIRAIRFIEGVNEREVFAFAENIRPMYAKPTIRFKDRDDQRLVRSTENSHWYVSLKDGVWCVALMGKLVIIENEEFQNTFTLTE